MTERHCIAQTARYENGEVRADYCPRPATHLTQGDMHVDEVCDEHARIAIEAGARDRGTIADRDALRVERAAHRRADAAIAAVLALHPKRDEPRYGCCARPQVCKGHGPECWGVEHGMSKPAWPCPTVAAITATQP